MSSTTLTSSPSIPTTGTPRPSARAWVARWRRALKRRQFVDAQQAHRREPLTDAYIDRHGTAQVDPRSVLAALQR